MGRKWQSTSLAAKLDKILKDDIISEVDSLLNDNDDLSRFVNGRELKEYLMEGSLLNIGKISSEALSVPNGKYIVWTTDAGHTMLVPVESFRAMEEVYENENKHYEVFTPDLVGNWRDINKVLHEEDDNNWEYFNDTEDTDAEDDENKEESLDLDNISSDDIDRLPLLRAVQKSYANLQQFADAVGVHKTTASRWLREYIAGSKSPKGRNPSIKNAERIARAVGLEVQAVFPDIFGKRPGSENPREATGGSGKGAHSATDEWATSESKHNLKSIVSEDKPYNKRGMQWSLSHGLFAIEDGTGGATLYKYDADDRDWQRTIQKYKTVDPQQFQEILNRRSNRTNRTYRRSELTTPNWES